MMNAYLKLLKESGYYIAFYGKYCIKDDTRDQQFDEYEIYDRNNGYHTSVATIIKHWEKIPYTWHEIPDKKL